MLYFDFSSSLVCVHLGLRRILKKIILITLIYESTQFECILKVNRKIHNKVNNLIKITLKDNELY